MWNIGSTPFMLLLTASMTQATTSNQPDWRWERDTPTCSLIQTHSADGEVVQLSRTPGSDVTTISVGSTERSFGSSKKLRDGKVTFIPGGASVAEIFLTEGHGRREVFASSQDSAFLSKFAGSSEVEIIDDKLGSTRVPLRSAAAAVEAIRICEDSRMREWGIDPVAWRALRARPFLLTDWSKSISADDYPMDALLSGSEGFMVLRFDVGANGLVQDCGRLVRGKPAQDRVRLCSKLKKVARFKPAVAPNGEAVAAPYVLVINFRIAA